MRKRLTKQLISESTKWKTSMLVTNNEKKTDKKVTKSSKRKLIG